VHALPWSLEDMAMSDLLEFRLLKYIAVIAETGNITRAVEKLFTSQPVTQPSDPCA